MTQAVVVSPARRSTRASVSERREKIRRDTLEILKVALANPLVVGLGAMAANEALYRAGFYDPQPGETSQSTLGGPVWITIGPSLPPAQQKRNLINGFIIGVTTAQAMGPAIAAGLRTVSQVGEVVQ